MPSKILEIFLEFQENLNPGSIEGRITFGNNQRLPVGVEPNSLGYGYEGMAPPLIWKKLDPERVWGMSSHNYEIPEISAYVQIRGVIPIQTVKLAERGKSLETDRTQVLPLNEGIENLLYAKISSAVRRFYMDKYRD